MVLSGEIDNHRFGDPKNLPATGTPNFPAEQTGLCRTG
jgi:hypothetical protein